MTLVTWFGTEYIQFPVFIGIYIAGRIYFKKYLKLRGNGVKIREDMDIKEGAQALSTGLECNRLFSISMKLRKLALLLLVAYVISGLGVQAAKRFVPRDRPGAVLAGVHYPYDIIIRKQDILKGDNSFPSGHTSITFAAATVAFLSIDSVWGFLILLLAMLVGISRVYLGVHYPSDVIAGMMLGILSGYIALWIPVVRKKKKVGYRI